MTAHVVALKLGRRSRRSKRASTAAEVIPFVPRPRRTGLTSKQLAERIAVLAELARTWGVRVSFPDAEEGGAA